MNRHTINKKEHYQKLTDSKLDALKVEDVQVNIVDIKPLLVNSECPICFDEIYNNDEYLLFVECHHSYHLNCINQWKVKSNSCSSVYKCELCQEYRDIKEFNQNEAPKVPLTKPTKLNWLKKCWKSLFS